MKRTVRMAVRSAASLVLLSTWPNGKRQNLVGPYVPRLEALHREREYVAW